IHKVSKKNYLPLIGMVRFESAGFIHVNSISQLSKQVFELIEAAVNISDDVKRSMLMTPIRPERLPFNHDVFNLLGSIQHMNITKSFISQPPQRAAQISHLLNNDMGSKTPVGSNRIALAANLFGQLKNDGNSKDMMIPGQRDQWLASFFLDIRCIDHSE